MITDAFRSPLKGAAAGIDYNVMVYAPLPVLTASILTGA
jgi:hypothetical protein